MGKRLRILHVDDDVVARTLVSDELIYHHVVSVGSMSGFESLYHEGGYDLILVDASVDDYHDGILLAMRLQRAGERVIILSSGSDPDVRVEFMSKGDINTKLAKRVEQIANERRR